MILETRKTHTFIEIYAVENIFTHHKIDKEERQEIIKNLEEVIEDLESYDE